MSQTEKRTRVQSIVQQLNDDLSTNTLSDAQRLSSLEHLKIYGRDPNGANAIYCRSGITTLSQYAFGRYSFDIIQEALRVIANALLLQPSLQAVLIELDGLANVARLYQNQDDDFEFLGGRILFVCTYSATSDFTGVISAGLLDSIEGHLARHADRMREPGPEAKPMEVMALTETAKLIFNLSNRHPEECKPLDSCVPDLCTIAQFCKDVTPPLDQPVGTILNALACLDFGAVPAQSIKDNTVDLNEGLVTRLVNLLDQAVKYYKPMQLDTTALSLITVLRMLYDTSSTGVQIAMQSKLFPADSERDLPLGQSSSLASRVLRLTTSPGLSHLPEAISSLLFEMSDKDAGKYVKNIGYGYAAGYLMTHRIPIPESLQDATTAGSSDAQIPINPVTGQRLDREPVPDIPEMTEEEKEREAERLFVLFERLKATGVVDIENPVKAAIEQGRPQDLSDSD